MTASLRRCSLHHTTVDRCPAPEIADVLDTLRELGIDLTLIAARHLVLDRCGGCADRDPSDGWLPETAVVRITYTPHGGSHRLAEDSCPLCVGPIVSWLRRYRATQITVWLPMQAGVSLPAGAR